MIRIDVNEIKTLKTADLILLRDAVRQALNTPARLANLPPGEDEEAFRKLLGQRARRLRKITCEVHDHNDNLRKKKPLSRSGVILETPWPHTFDRGVDNLADVLNSEIIDIFGAWEDEVLARLSVLGKGETKAAVAKQLNDAVAKQLHKAVARHPKNTKPGSPPPIPEGPVAELDGILGAITPDVLKLAIVDTMLRAHELGRWQAFKDLKIRQKKLSKPPQEIPEVPPLIESPRISINEAFPSDYVSPDTYAYMEQVGISISDKVSSNMQERMRLSLVEGILEGEDVFQLRDRVKGFFDAPLITAAGAKMTLENWAMMVARTEAIRFSAEGRLYGYEQSKVVRRVEFIATFDERTCPDCQALDGQVFLLEEAHGIIPVHPLCRCTFAVAQFMNDDWTDSEIQEFAEEALEAA